MGIQERLKRRKWAENTRNDIVAYKYLATLCMLEYGEKLGFGESPTNYAHKIWMKNRSIIPPRDTVPYQKEIESDMEFFKASSTYQMLSQGEAEPETFISALMQYDYVVKNGGCGK